MRLNRVIVLFFALLALGARAIGDGWTPPVDEVAPEYEVEVAGKKVKLLLVHMTYSEDRVPMKGVYWVANFPYAPGEAIRVTSTQPLDAAEMRPAGRVGTLRRVSPKEVVFSAKGPFHVVLEREGRVKPLILFGNAPERDVPDRNDPNVKWFGPGAHKVDALELTSGQTLYLDYGATVYGAIRASGDNITIRGHGVFSGQIYRAWHGPAPMFFLAYRCRNLTVRDLVVTAPFSWTLALQDCENSLLDNVKVCSSRTLADDGIDLINCRKMTVRNCFIRSQDDVIAFKGMDEPKTPCEDILVENCEMWCDTANVFRLGYECHASGMGRLTVRDIDVLHYSPVNLPWRKQWSHSVFWLQPSGDLPIGDVLFENVRIHSDGDDLNLAIAHPRVTACSPGECGSEGRTRVFYKGGGSVSNVVFRNVSVTGTPGPWRVVAEGLSDRECVRNVRFENVTVFGRRLEWGMPEIHIGPHAEGIAFARSSKFTGFPTRGLIAHRGDAAEFPENTIPAFESAVRKGAAMVELDEWRCKTGELVVMHDRHVDRTTDGKGLIEDLSLAEIKRLDAGVRKGKKFAGLRVPTIEEALAAFPKTGILLNIHCKTGDAAPEVAELVRREGRLEQCVLMMDTREDLVALKRKCPWVRTGLVQRFEAWPGDWPAKAPMDAQVDDAIALGVDLFQMIANCRLTPAAMKRLHDADIRTTYFDCQRPGDFAGLVAEGHDYIFVDRYSALRGAYEGAGYALTHRPTPEIAAHPSHRKEWWPDRFKASCARARALKDVDVVFAGDSITHFWENSGKAVWAEITNRYAAVNAGYAGDRTENMLWRFRNGELDGYRARLFLVLIGTNNNIADGRPEDTAGGIRLIVDEIRKRQPQATVALMRMLPRAHRTDPTTGDTPDVKNAKTSEMIRKFADGDKIVWLDFDSRFRNDRDGPRPDLFFDSLHPSAKGYEVWRDCLMPVIERYCGKRLTAVRTVPHELDELVRTGHVQGADCTEEGIYLSHASGIAMIDWNGRVVRRTEAPNHLGDVACHDGKVYGAFVLRDEVKNGQRGLVKVWNARLEPIAERYFVEPLDGIVVLNGTIYVGVDRWGGVYHPHCCVKRLDMDLNDRGNVEFDLGYEILAGVQTMATDGRDLFFGNYGGTSRVSADLKTNSRVAFPCAEGFGLVPKGVSGRESPVFFCVKALGGNMSGWRKDPVNNPPQVELRFFACADGVFSDITKADR